MSGIDLSRPIGETVDDIPFDGPYVEEGREEFEQSVQGGGLNIDLGFLKTETGQGSIEERLDHPMNFSKSKGVAQIIRGLEGMFGALNLAIVDIGLGLVEVIKERRAANVG